jgi:hypothetical protein
MPKWTQEDDDRMNAAAQLAEQDLAESVPVEAIEKVIMWIDRWYMRAGYKRLVGLLRKATNEGLETRSASEIQADLDTIRKV